MGLLNHTFSQWSLRYLVIAIGICSLLARVSHVGSTIVIGNHRGHSLAGLHIGAAGIEVGIIFQNPFLAHHIAQTLLSGESESIGAIVAGDDIFAELRVEHPDFVNRDIQDSCYLIEVYILVHHYGVGGELALHHSGCDAVVA